MIVTSLVQFSGINVAQDVHAGRSKKKRARHEGIVNSLHYLCTNGKIYVSLANFQDVDFIDALNLPLAHKVMRKMMHTA